MKNSVCWMVAQSSKMRKCHWKLKKPLENVFIRFDLGQASVGAYFLK